MTWTVHQEEIVEWLKEYDGPRFHGILSDPPYALISIAKRFGGGHAPAQEGSDGRYARLSKGFMGQDWDGFESYQHYQDWVAQWSTLLIKNALHPGAVCLFFGGTRTFHHLGVGLERGGFEIIDSVLIPWLHGQGFPKSHDISKGMDKAAGAERETVGKNPNFRDGPTSGHRSYHEGWDDERWTMNPNITKPSTTEAEQWDGYGTALKPAWEPVFVCRAPRGNHTFAELAKIYGTGGLNIDGSRIAHSDPPEDTAVREDRSNWRMGTRNRRLEQGRWPANLALTHHEACVKVGEYMVEGRTINRFTQDMMPFGGAKGEEYETEEMPPDLVDWYACVSGCPVRALDDQASGKYHASGQTKKRNSGKGQSSLDYSLKGDTRGYGYDGANPSRFFYTAKASRSEKDKGLEHYFWQRTSKGGWKRISEEEWAKLDKPERAQGCIHPTVKPLALLRYLANLFKPPDTVKSRLLVPFSGSGSEMIAGLQAGWSEVEGVEMEEIYTMMSTDRINANIGMF